MSKTTDLFKQMLLDGQFRDGAQGELEIQASIVATNTIRMTIWVTDVETGSRLVEVENVDIPSGGSVHIQDARKAFEVTIK